MSHHTIVFDTFQYAKDLKKAGFTEIQIETQVKYAKKQCDDVLAIIDNNLATKHDIELLRKDIEIIRKDTKYIMLIGSIFGAMIPIGFTILGFLIKLH
jgi:hypothetical protein